MLHDSDEAWKKYGEIEPYFGVCTQPQFLSDNLTEDARAAFFQSGEDHVRTVMEIVKKQFPGDVKLETALDFGCGVGRLVVPFAKRFQEVVGIDVSEGMLDEARRNCDEIGLNNVSFYSNLDRVPVTKTFDVVHTFIVLQHISTARGLDICLELIDRVADGGIGVLHMTYWREASHVQKFLRSLRRWVPLFHNVINVFQRRSFRQPFMQMNCYPINSVLQILQNKNCDNVVLRFTDHGGYRGAVFFFRKQRLQDFK